MNNNINNQPNPFFDPNNIVDESFSLDYADTFQKQMQLENNNLNETVLEQKYRNVQQGNQNQYNNYFMNQYQNINCFEDNVTIQNRKEGDYLKMRNWPKYSEREFLDVKKVLEMAYYKSKIIYLLNLKNIMHLILIKKLDHFYLYLI